MSYDEAHQVISWAVAAIVVLPAVWATRDWCSHGAVTLVRITARFAQRTRQAWRKIPS